MNRPQLPELVVFDLDLTLWECGDAIWCDCLSPPFHRDGPRLVDQRNNQIRLFDDVPAILDRADRLGIPMALASRTQQPTWAKELLQLLQIEHRFVHSEIYPAAKFSHFSSLRDESGVEYQQMLFFDDEQRNVRDITQLGVTCKLIRGGMTKGAFDNALSCFAKGAHDRD